MSDQEEQKLYRMNLNLDEIERVLNVSLQDEATRASFVVPRGSIGIDKRVLLFRPFDASQYKMDSKGELFYDMDDPRNSDVRVWSQRLPETGRVRETEDGGGVVYDKEDKPIATFSKIEGDDDRVMLRPLPSTTPPQK